MLESLRPARLLKCAYGVGPEDNHTVRFAAARWPPAGYADPDHHRRARPDRLAVGIGLTKLSEETLLLDTEAGVLAAWGFQSPVIGTIGMGIVFPADRFIQTRNLPHENQVVLHADKNQKLVYHIQCDWLRGRRFDRCPGAADWFNEVRALAARLKMNPSQS